MKSRRKLLMLSRVCTITMLICAGFWIKAAEVDTLWFSLLAFACTTMGIWLLSKHEDRLLQSFVDFQIAYNKAAGWALVRFEKEDQPQEEIH